MAAYAAVVSLLNTVDQLQNHACLSTFLDRKQTESLCGKLRFLQDFLERYSHGGRKHGQADSERLITYAAYAAEHLIESQVARLTDQGGFRHLPDLQIVIEDMESLKEKVVVIRDMRTVEDQPLSVYSGKAFTSSTTAPRVGKTNMVVGFEGQPHWRKLFAPSHPNC